VHRAKRSHPEIRLGSFALEFAPFKQNLSGWVAEGVLRISLLELPTHRRYAVAEMIVLPRFPTTAIVPPDCRRFGRNRLQVERRPLS